MKTKLLAPIALAALAFGAVAIAYSSQPGAVQPRQVASTAPANNTAPARVEATDPLRVQQHDFLRKLAGVWEGQAHILSSDDQSVQGVFGCVNTVTFGHYLTCSYSGKLMGENFHAVQTWGYNTAKGQFETTWIDNNSTAIAFNTGTCNDSGTVFTISGTTEDPSGQSVTQKAITTILDNDHYTLELFTVNDGQDSPVMTVSFARSGEIVPHAPARNVTSRDTGAKAAWQPNSYKTLPLPPRSTLPQGTSPEPRATQPNTAPKANQPAEISPTQTTDADPGHEPDQPK